MFDKKALFTLNDRKIEKVECPEWGELGQHIYVRTMSGSARDSYEMAIHNASVEDENGMMYNMRAMMAVAVCCDKDGNLLFEPSDAKALGEKSAAVLDRIFDVGKRLSKMSSKDVEEMEKSLESDPS